MRRREFIALLGGMTAAWPLSVRAQQGERVRHIGVLTAMTANDPEAQARNAVFEQSLRQLGWTVGRDLQIDYRSLGGEAASIRRGASELVALAPDVLLAVGTSTTGPLLQATQTIPVVFVNSADPVGAGFVQSLARPGGNATGFTNFEYSVTENRSNYSSKLRRKSHVWQSFAILLGQLASASSAQSRQWRSLWGLSHSLGRSQSR